MIRLRLASLGDSQKGDLEISIVDGESLQSAIERSLKPIPLDEPAANIFQVLLNGHKVESEMWSNTVLKCSDTILVAPIIRGGDDSGLLRTAILIGVTIAASVFLPGLGPAFAAGTFGLGLATAAVSIATSMLLSGLFPPPVLDSLAGGAGGDTLSQSQMYTITNQANTVRKFGTVPQVYGTHRMFPVLAANPYTEIAVDPSSGELVSYYYAIYDFGFGPLQVGGLMIGDTPIQEYSDLKYNYVDLNRPLADEGPWDTNVKPTFQIYKGDNTTEDLGIAINKNANDGSAPDTYEAVRNSNPNPNNRPQEIILSMVNPRGLFAYSSTGQLVERSITLEIHFLDLENPNGWNPYNDFNAVNDWDGVGGDSDFTIIPAELYPIVAQNPLSGPYAIVRNGPRHVIAYSGATPSKYADEFGIGIPKGATTIVMKKPPIGSNASNLIYWNGNFIGKTVSQVAYAPDTNYATYTLESPTEINIEFWNVYRVTETSPPNIYWNWGGLGLEFLAPLNPVPTNIGRRKDTLGRAKITRADTNPVYSTFRFTPKTTSQVAVRVTRISSASSVNSQIQDALSWASISTRLDASPIVTDKRHLFLEMKIRATNQLNGSISNLSAVCQSVLEVYNGSTWEKQVTANPAWVFADLMTGQINKRAVAKSRLHLPSLIEWAAFATVVPESSPSIDYILPRFQTNFVLDYAATVQSVVNQVTAAAQASLNIIDGKYGVLIDKLKTVPIQIFTPRNSKDFSSTKIFSKKPHALKVKYIDPKLEWQVSECIVYDEGYNDVTATEFEEVTSFGVTNFEQAFRFGRYMLAQNRLRQETITLVVDFEHLVCTRGDYVQIVQDPMLVGGSAARVKAVNGTEIQIDEGIETSGLLDYGYTYRSSATGAIGTATLEVVNSDTFTLNGDIPAVSDLIVIGVVDFITFDCIVKGINPNDDLSATLTLVEKADGIYDSESTDTLPPYDPQISPTVDADFAPPNEVVNLEVVDNFWECFGRGYRYYVDLDWDEPTGSSYEFFEVYVNDGTGFDLAGTTRSSLYKHIVDTTRLGIEHSFKVIAVSASGKKLDLGNVGSVVATPLFKVTAPSDVEQMSVDITAETLQLFWPAIADCDCDEYLIRYNPTLFGTWENSIPLLRTDRNTTLAATQARTGTYLIKAVDFNGNESENAAVAVTTIPNLFNLNVIEVITDFPGLLGPKDLTVKEGDTLVLQPSIVGVPGVQEYHPVGYYYYDDLLDLSEIYTVRLQSLINAEGYSPEDLMLNWVTLDSVALLANSASSEWDVETEYRTTDILSTMSDWTSLSDVNFLNEGDADNWTAWKKFVIGDATGRIFQFRLKLISNQASVTPRVFDGTIRADMPDRIESYNNQAAPNTGLQINFDPRFKGPLPAPAVQISMESAQSGDYWEFISKDTEGFTILFRDKNGIAVARTFDAQVKGYGRSNSNII